MRCSMGRRQLIAHRVAPEHRARMAHLAARGNVDTGDDFVHESIIGSLFRGRVEATTTVGGIPAIIPSIEGWARVTGFNTIFLNDDDPSPQSRISGVVEWESGNGKHSIGMLSLSGGGAIGLCAAYFLSRQGATVTVLEQETSGSGKYHSAMRVWSV